MTTPDRGRRCPSCGSRLSTDGNACAICGHRVPWRWTRQGVLVESALVVGLVAVAALALLWTRRNSSALMRPEERVARLDVVGAPPTDVATFTPEPSSTATAPPATATAAPTAATTTHVVASGETLFAIAAQYDVPADEIVSLNALERPEALSVGQELVIPVPGPAEAQDVADEVAAGDEAAAESATEAPTEAPAEAVAQAPTGAEAAAPVLAEPETYEVKSGDTLGAIAARYGVPLDELLELNAEWLSSVNQTLQVGDRVVVSAAVAVTATPIPEPSPMLASAPAMELDVGPGEVEVAGIEPVAGRQYPAPAILAPGDGDVLQGPSVLLRWSSVGVLPPRVNYVVTIRDDTEPEEDAEVIWLSTNATSLRVPGDYRPALGAPRTIAWTVSVRRRGGRVMDREGTLLGPKPVPSTFTWSSDG